MSQTKEIKADDLLKIGINELTEEQVGILSQIVKAKKKKPKVAKPVIEKLSTTHPKYLMTVKFINVILKKNNLQEIKELAELTEFFKEYLLIENVDKLIDENINEILTVFTVTEINYMRRVLSTQYLLILIKAMIKQTGYKLCHKSKRIQKNNLAQAKYFYYIK